MKTLPMKITVTLTPAEVRGLRKYLAAVSPDVHPVILKKDIAEWVNSAISAELHSPRSATSDYIK